MADLRLEGKQYSQLLVNTFLEIKMKIWWALQKLLAGCLKGWRAPWSFFWIAEKLFMLADIRREFPLGCANIWGFPLYFAITFAWLMSRWQIRINLWLDAAQHNLYFPLRANFHLNWKHEHTWGSEGFTFQISPMYFSPHLYVKIIYGCRSHPISPAVSSLHIKPLSFNWFHLQSPKQQPKPNGAFTRYNLDFLLTPRAWKCIEGSKVCNCPGFYKYSMSYWMRSRRNSTSVPGLFFVCGRVRNLFTNVLSRPWPDDQWHSPQLRSEDNDISHIYSCIISAGRVADR